MRGRWHRAFQTILKRRRFEAEMAEEMRFHIEACTNDLLRAGVSPQEAARRARMEFGGLDNAKDDCREALGLRLVDELGRQVRHALRLMRRSPGFTATALATLGLCLGANLTIFAVVNAVLLRPLPFPSAGRLVSVFNTYPRAGVPNDGCSLANYYERRGHRRAFSSMSVYRDRIAIVGVATATERIDVTRVSPDFFSTLGVGPAQGRAFTDAETTYRAGHVAIVTDGYWRQRLDGDPDVIGRAIRIDGIATTVVGVLPAGFSFLSSLARVYLPLASDAEERTARERHAGTAHMIARLNPESTIAEAQAEIDNDNEAMKASDPDAAMMADAGFRSIAVPLHAAHVAEVRPVLLLIQVGALFLLFIGAANLMNLLLIRASARARELAVRRAIGASWQQIACEVMVETTVLTVLGGLIGLAGGAVGIRALATMAARLPLGGRIAFDWRLGVVALVGSVATGIAIGIPVIWYHLRGSSGTALPAESRSSTGGRTVQRLRHGFLVVQMALAFVLLAGTGLLGVSLVRAAALSPGFRPANVLSGQVTMRSDTYRDASARLTFTEGLLSALAGSVGVRRAGIATNLPLSGINNKSAATVQGAVLRPGEPPHGYFSYAVGGDYFAAMGITLLDGRFLTGADSRRGERVCVVDEDFARRNWPPGQAIGQRVFEGSAPGSNQDAFTVVGVVAPVKQAELTEDEAQGAIYYPYRYRPETTIYVVTRADLAPAPMASTLRNAVRVIDPEVPVSDLRSMDARVADSLVTRRSPALLAAVFSSIAVLLTAIGTYGVLSYAVAQRRREIGLRMALGARPDQIRRQFVSLAVRLVGLGSTIGLLGSWITARAMQALLYGVPALHVPTLAATAAVLTIVCLGACLRPAALAARISPMEALADL